MVVFRSSSRIRTQVVVGIALALLASSFTSVARAEGSPNGSVTFSPQPITQDRFKVGPAEPGYVQAPDDGDMYVEVFRPVRAEKGPDVPGQIPVILLMTPYEGEGPWGDPTPIYHQWRDYFVKKGYAFAISHVYGTGNSEGCLEYFGPNELAATSAVIEHLGSRSWSNGAVGMFGTSYDGGHALHAAARSSERAKKLLRAVVSEAGLVSAYDVSGHDGVAFGGSSTSNFLAYAPFNHTPSLTNAALPQVDPAALAERQVGACRVENASAQIGFEANGDFAKWFGERSARSANKVRAATLMFQGLHDWQVTPIAPVGFFDRIPQNVPHNLVLGQWQHARTVFHRADWMSMIHAWFDRHLLELPTHTEQWPEVQIQDSEGVWRHEAAWPNSKNPAGQLALGAEGRLGTTEPSGSTSFYEGGAISSGVGAATFTTPPLTSPLRLAGLPVLDLWTTIDRDDAHIAATLRAFDGEGNLITSHGGVTGDSVGRFPITAYRSLQHLKPLVDGEFRQSKPEPAPLRVPIHVPVRFFVPVDLVVPDGGRLSITISGTALPDYGGVPSGSGARVEILHDCATNHASVLRFLMPDPGRTALSVTEGPDAIAPSAEDPNPVALTGPPSEPGSNDGGIASGLVCDERALDPFKLWNP